MSLAADVHESDAPQELTEEAALAAEEAALAEAKRKRIQQASPADKSTDKSTDKSPTDKSTDKSTDKPINRTASHSGLEASEISTEQQQQHQMVQELLRRPAPLGATAQALRDYRSLAEKAPEYHVATLAAASDQLGTIYQLRKEYKSELAARKDAVALYEYLYTQRPDEFGDWYGLCLGSLGGAHLRQTPPEPPAALAAFNKSMPILQQHFDQFGLRNFDQGNRYKRIYTDYKQTCSVTENPVQYTYQNDYPIIPRPPLSEEIKPDQATFHTYTADNPDDQTDDVGGAGAGNKFRLDFGLDFAGDDLRSGDAFWAKIAGTLQRLRQRNPHAPLYFLFGGVLSFVAVAIMLTRG